MNHIHQTQHILEDLNNKIIKRKPWSLVRLGDAGTGIISAFRAPGVVDRGKWNGRKGKRKANILLGQLTVPMVQRERLITQVINSMCNADYIDHYDSFQGHPSKKGVGVLGEKQHEIHEAAGIDNGGNFCNPFVHYFSIVQDEYNLFDIMKGRRIFCITSRNGVIKRLEEKSQAKVIHSYRIPRRGRKAGHYKFHFQKVCNIVKNRSKKYDLFLVGAGLLAVVYCGLIKKHGGRAFDIGRLFDFWSGARAVDSKPKRYIHYNSGTMLCTRKKLPGKNSPRSGVW